MSRNRGQYRPGQSGNPRGRPPRAATREDATRADAAPAAPAQYRTGTAAPSQIRHDSWTNPATGHGTHRDARTMTGFRVDVVTDLEAIGLRRSEFLCKRIIEALPEEALRRGWHLKLEDKELAEDLCKYTEDLGLDEVLVEAAQKEREAGGAALFPVMEGAQGDLSTPLDEGAIGAIRAFHILEPRELYPIDYYDAFTDKRWAKPSVYMMTPIATGQASWVGAQPIHASRLIIFPGTSFTRQVQLGQRVGWGDNALTPVKTVLSDFGIAWGSAATLLQKHGKETWAVDRLADMLRQKDGLEQFDKHVAATELAWSVLRMNVIDGKDKIERSTGTLAGVHELLAEFKQLVAAAAETPVSILMGTTSTALRTGDDDTRSWYATVQKYRKRRISPQHRRAIQLCMLAGDSPTGGAVPKLWTVEYPPLWEPDEGEHATRLKTDMERAQIAINAGVASADDVAESFYGGDTYSGDIVIDWDRRKAQKKINEQRAEGLSPEDRAALGREGEPAPNPAAAEDDELSDEDHADLSALEDEYGGAEDDEEDLEDDDEGGDDESEEDDTAERQDSFDWREDGPGYNPYRDKGGKFAPGAHAARPHKDGRAAAQIEKAKGRVDKAAEKLKAAKAAKKAAVGDARAAIRSAKSAATLARKEPTAKNVKAAQAATNKATRAAAKVDKHSIAVAKHTEAHVAAKAAHVEAKLGKPGAIPAAVAKPKVKSTPSLAPHQPAPAAKTNQELAGIAHDAASRIPSTSLTKGSSSAFLSDVHAAMTPAERNHFGGDLEAFKAKMEGLSRGGHVALSRADVPLAHVNGGKTEADRKASSAKTEASDTHDRFGSRHFLDLPARMRQSTATSEAGGHATENAASPHGEARALSPSVRHITSEQEFHAMQDEFRARLTPDEVTAAKRYSGDSYIDVNRHLRGDERYATLGAREASIISGLDAALVKGRTTEAIVTHRAAQFDPGSAGHSLKPGDTFSDKGFVSTAYRSENIERFGNVHFVITSPAGTKIAAIPSMAGEGEMLMARGSTMRITHREDHGDGRVTLHATVASQD